MELLLLDVLALLVVEGTSREAGTSRVTSPIAVAEWSLKSHDARVNLESPRNLKKKKKEEEDNSNNNNINKISQSKHFLCPSNCSHHEKAKGKRMRRVHRERCEHRTRRERRKRREEAGRGEEIQVDQCKDI